MRVRVETFAGHGGVEMPRRIYFDERCIEVAENLDQWHGPDYLYFKLRGDDGNLYILRLDEDRAEWSLTLFQSTRAVRASRRHFRARGEGRRRKCRLPGAPHWRFRLAATAGASGCARNLCSVDEGPRPARRPAQGAAHHQ